MKSSVACLVVALTLFPLLARAQDESAPPDAGVRADAENTDQDAPAEPDPAESHSSDRGESLIDLNPEWGQLGSDDTGDALRDAAPGGAEQDAEGEGQQNAGEDTVLESPVRYTFQVVASLCVVLALFLLGAWAFQRFGRRSHLMAPAELGQVIGKLHLTPNTTLHFVRTGGQVLVIGVTPNAISPIANFDVRDFESREEPPDSSERATSDDNVSDFLQELRMQQGKMAGAANDADAENEDEDIASIKGDIARLQRMLREKPDEPHS